MNWPRFCVLVLLIGFAAVLRVVDHPWNIAPVGALALFAGAHFRDKRWAFVVPLAAMFLGDVGVGLRNENSSHTFHGLMPLTYGCYAVSVVLGMGIRRSWDLSSRTSQGSRPRFVHTADKVIPVVGGTLAAALLFFVVTNFGVWAIFPTYAKTWAGLMQCYVAALPFFRNTLAGDAFYVALLFGGFALLQERLGLADESSLLHAK